MNQRAWLYRHPLPSSLLALAFFSALGWLLASIPQRYITAFLLIPLLFGIALVWVHLSTHAIERYWILKICLMALGIRIAISFSLEFLWSSFEGVSDGAAYGPHAAALAQTWHRSGWATYAEVVAVPVGAPGYVYFSASIFWLLGYNSLYIKLINGLLAAITVIYTYKLGKHFFDERVGRLSALIAAFMPSIMLWTSQNLKDSMVVFFSMWALWLAAQGLGRGLVNLAKLGAVIAALATVRRETAIGLAIIIALTFIFQTRAAGIIRVFASVVGITILGFTLAYSGYGFLGRDFVESRLSIESINATRQATAYGGSAVDTRAGNGIQGLVRFLPQATANFLLRPWPWEATNSVTQLMTIPESVFIWYPLFGLSLVGLLFCWRTRPLQTSLLWVYILAATVAAAPQYGNLGTAYRHRVQLWPCFFIFAAVGWYLWRDRQREHLSVQNANPTLRMEQS